MELVVDFEFCAAHRLPRHPGRCFRMHGHSYRLQVMVSGTLDSETGMVVDFFDIEDAAGRVVDSIRDTCLNDILENPMAEAIVVWLWQQIEPSLDSLSGLRLFETESCHVTYRGEAVPAGLLKAGVPGRHPSTA